MKTIHQLAKIARRIPRRLRGIDHALAKAGLKPKQAERLTFMKRGLRHTRLLLNMELGSRNVDGATIRCAFPKKKQRALGLLPAV